MRIRFLFAALLIVLVGCDSNNTNDDLVLKITRAEVAAISMEPGIRNDEVSLGGIGTFLFTIAVPEMQANEKVPLVLALHYEGDLFRHFSENYLRTLPEPSLRDLGAIILAPDVVGTAWSDPLSEAAVMAFLKVAVEEWPVDPDRLVITGYSMGGEGAWFLRSRYPERFSAAIPMAANPFGDLVNKTPTLIIHSRADEEIRFATVENAVNLMQENNIQATLVSSDTLSHYLPNQYVDLLGEAVVWLEDDVWKE